VERRIGRTTNDERRKPFVLRRSSFVTRALHAPRSTLYGLLGVILILVGYWQPWIPHRDSGLALTAWDLTEWIKFLPAWRAGKLGVQREAFYLPLVAAALALSLMAARWRSRPARWALRGLAAILCLLALPYYPLILSAYRGGEGQLQFYLSLAGLALILLSPLARRWPASWQGVGLVIAGVLGLIPPLWQLAVLRPTVAQLYAEPVGWGIGAILNSVGFGLIVLTGSKEWFAARSNLAYSTVVSSQ